MSAAEKNVQTFKLDELLVLKLTLAHERLHRANEMATIRAAEAQALSESLKASLEEGGKYELIDVALDGTVRRRVRAAADAVGPVPINGTQAPDLAAEPAAS